MTQHTPSPNPPRRAARFLGVVLALLASVAVVGSWRLPRARSFTSRGTWSGLPMSVIPGRMQR